MRSIEISGLVASNKHWKEQKTGVVPYEKSCLKRMYLFVLVYDMYICIIYVLIFTNMCIYIDGVSPKWLQFHR